MLAGTASYLPILGYKSYNYLLSLDFAKIIE